MNLDLISAGGGGWALTDRSPDLRSMAPPGCPGSLQLLLLGLVALLGLGGIATLAHPLHRLARQPGRTVRDAAAGTDAGTDAEESAF